MKKKNKQKIKLSNRVEKVRKQVQVSAKQVLEKMTVLTQFVVKKTKFTGALAKKRWYYFAVVIIIFIIVIPFVSAKNFAVFKDLGSEKAAQGPVLELVEDKPIDYQEQGMPTDLFSEGHAARMAEEKSDEESKEAKEAKEGEQAESAAAAELESVAKLVPRKELEKVAMDSVDSEETIPEISLSWPVMGMIVSDYGQGYSKAFNDYRFNQGINLAGEEKAQVKAAASGKVESIGEDLFYNKFLILKHENSYTTFYGNLDQIAVEEGDSVESGTIIGTIGKPGYHSLGLGANLFFRLNHAETSLNPNKFIKN